MRFMLRKLEFRLPALGPVAPVTLAVFVFGEDGCPQCAVVRDDRSVLTSESFGIETGPAIALCQEIRSIADNSTELRALVESLGNANWSLTLTESAPLLARTLDMAIDEASATLEMCGSNGHLPG